MFNTAHILYIILSTLATAAILVVLGLFVKDGSRRRWVLKLIAILTVVIHYSSLWVDYFRDGEATVDSSMLLPAYPCNIIMWLLLIVALSKSREGWVYRAMCEFCFLGGIVCGVIGIVFNENYGSNPTLADYHVLKGLLSHSTMIFGCIYLRVGGFMRVSLYNVASVTAGLMLFIVIGVTVNMLYRIFDLGSCNCMYLEEAPFPDLPFINTWTIGVAGVLITALIGFIAELTTLPREERTVAKLKSMLAKRKESQQ